MAGIEAHTLFGLHISAPPEPNASAEQQSLFLHSLSLSPSTHRVIREWKEKEEKKGEKATA